MTTEAVDYVLAYGGRCRDCADNTGVCPISGLPCADPNKAVHHIINALRYGIQNGFVPAFEAGGKVSAGGDIDAVRASFLKGWDACWCRKPDCMERDGGRQKAWQKYRASLDHNNPRSNFTLHRAEPLPPEGATP